MTEARAGAPLYSTDLLALAVSLADHPFDPKFPLHGEARSRTCGGNVVFGCSTSSDGSVDRFGFRVSACAVGQAAAAIFAHAAAGRTRDEIAAARDEIARWLAGEGDQTAWPGVERLAPALPYPGRHGAIPLAWDAALAALPIGEPAR